MGAASERATPYYQAKSTRVVWLTVYWQRKYIEAGNWKRIQWKIGIINQDLKSVKNDILKIILVCDDPNNQPPLVFTLLKPAVSFRFSSHLIYGCFFNHGAYTKATEVVTNNRHLTTFHSLFYGICPISSRHCQLKIYSLCVKRWIRFFHECFFISSYVNHFCHFSQSSNSFPSLGDASLISCCLRSFSSLWCELYLCHAKGIWRLTSTIDYTH